MKKITQLIFLLALFNSNFSNATPITITQTFSNVGWSNYGVSGGIGYDPNGNTYSTETGNWIFTGTVDSNAIDVSPGNGYAMYELTNLTLTQASLGLFDARITNVTHLWFHADYFVFSAPWESFTVAWSGAYYESNHFTAAPGDRTLAQNIALISSSAHGEFGPQWHGFLFEDGRRLYGWGVGDATVSLSSVPIPAAAWLFGSGLIGLISAARRRNNV